MPLTIPVSVNYPSPLTAVPSNMQDEPVEGRKQVPCEVDWSNMGGSAKCVSFNLQNNATLNLSQISTIKVDNSHSTADVVFLFPDTGDSIDIPAGTALAIVPVLSNALAFFVSAPSAGAGDLTRFTLLNYPVPPTSVAPTFEGQSFGVKQLGFGSGAQVGFASVGTGRGVLQNLHMAAEVNTTTAALWEGKITFTDGSNPNVNYGDYWVSCPANSTQLGPPLDLNGVEISYQSSITATLLVVSAAGTLAGRFNISATWIKG